MLSTVYELSPKDLAPAIEMLLGHQQLVLQDPETDKLDTFRSEPLTGA